jgi:NAD-dependent SIR2 family protein deacetylase
LGYPPVQRAKPNFTHLSLAKLTFEGRITQHITQNVTSLKSVELKEYKVDGLLHRAFQILGPESEQQPGNAILELHGSLRHVVCLYCKSKLARSQFQKDLERLNSHWAQLLLLEDRKLRLNPDGDVDVPSSLTGQSKAFEYRSFRYAACPVCNELYSDTEFLRVDSEGAWTGGTRGLVKPEVIFFGENVSDETRHQVERSIESCDQILVVGTTLAVLSAQRLVRAVKNQGKRIAIVNAGYVRDEEKLLDSNDIRIWWRTSDVFKHIESLAHLSS